MDLKLKKGFRRPTTDEIIMGIGLAFMLNMMVVNPLMKGHWTEDWQMPVVLFISAIMGIFSAMKLRDGQRSNAMDKIAKIEISGDWVRAHCTRTACTGEIIVKPIADADTCFMCPVCRQELRAGKNSRGEFVAYSPVDGCRAKI